MERAGATGSGRGMFGGGSFSGLLRADGGAVADLRVEGALFFECFLTPALQDVLLQRFSH